MSTPAAIKDDKKDKAPSTAVERASMEKPLNQHQQRSLTKLVLGDFEELSAQLRRELEKRQAERIRTVNEQYGDDTTLRAARTRVEEFAAKVRREMNLLVDDLAAKNIRCNSGYTLFTLNVHTQYLNLSGHKEAIDRVTRAHNRLVSLVTDRLASHRRLAERKIIMAGITGEAASALLNNMPAPHDVIREVMESLQEDAGADLEELRAGLDYIEWGDDDSEEIEVEV